MAYVQHMYGPYMAYVLPIYGLYNMCFSLSLSISASPVGAFWRVRWGERAKKTFSFFEFLKIIKILRENTFQMTGGSTLKWPQTLPKILFGHPWVPFGPLGCPLGTLGALWAPFWYPLGTILVPFAPFGGAGGMMAKPFNMGHT